MKTRIALLLMASALMVIGCAGGSPELDPIEEPAQVASIDEDLLLAAAESYAISGDLLPEGCQASGPGTARPNSGVLEARSDGQAYLDASRRIEGWQIQFDCQGNPGLIVNVVNTYETLEGAAITLSRTWHGEVWERIDSGQLEQLENIPGLGDLQIVFQDANGTVGVEFVHRNVYFFMTGTSVGGVDNYAFFSELANRYLASIQAGQ